MTTVFLTLGEVTFANEEVPRSINFGGDQALGIHQLVGGQRVINSMGRVDDDITWSGMFFGSTATFRARFLDQLRVLGAPLPLSWAQFNYSVVIKSFRAQFERSYQIPYSITVSVIQDLDKPLAVLLPVGYNDVVQQEMTDAIDLANLVANPSVGNSLALLAVAINAVPSLTSATASQISSILGPLGTATSAVVSAITQETSGINPFGLSATPTTVVYPLPDEIAESTLKSAQLYDILAILVNMNTNLMLIKNGQQGQTINTQNANLYQLAAKYYSDATRWTTIAEANGLVSPYVTGGQIVRVVLTNGGTDYVKPTVTAVGDYTVLANLKPNVVNGVIESIDVVTPGDFLHLPEILILEHGHNGIEAHAHAICSKKLVIPQASTASDGIWSVH